MLSASESEAMAANTIRSVDMQERETQVKAQLSGKEYFELLVRTAATLSAAKHPAEGEMKLMALESVAFAVEIIDAADQLAYNTLGIVTEVEGVSL
jgi:hypothetical protein